MAKFKEYQTGIGEELLININTLLPKDHLAYFIEESVNKLDTSAIECNYSELGQSGYHPKMMLSLLFYGYIIGIRSGRKIATACEENIVFIYLSKSYFPKKTVINEFRRKHYKTFEDLFIQVLMLFDLSDRDSSTSIFDGSKLEANASKKRTKTKAKYKKWLAELSEDIEELEAELSVKLSKEASVELKKKRPNALICKTR